MPIVFSSKRKVKPVLDTSRKKTKTKHLSPNDLPWRTVVTPKQAEINNDLEGILGLEEVDDVEVIYEETEGGKVIRFNVIGSPEPVAGGASDDVEEDIAGPSSPPSSRAGPEDAPPDKAPFDSETLLSNWHPFALHPQLSCALYAQSFTVPTPIQSKAIPAALQGKDVVGVAETGSGKTLAYGLPILHYLLDHANPAELKQHKRPLRALVLAPTRELALQVSSHLNACLSSYTEFPKEIKEGDENGVSVPSKPQKKKRNEKGKEKEVTQIIKPKGPPLVSVAAIVGGMSPQKQRRILDRGVDVLVATPGRLWDIIQEDDDLAGQISALKFLVLDEADRMTETGHFAELDNILRLTLRQSTDEETDPPPPVDSDSAPIEDTLHERFESDQEQLQTFVFSATLSKDLQRNLKKRFRPKYKNSKNSKPASTLDDLVMKLDFRDPDPEVIDLSPEGGVVSTLKESKIDCLSNNKDAYLYYFLLRYPGRSLVFLSSIDGIRRLMPLMELLEIKAFPLHSQLEQRQRLKNLDRFKSNAHSVLLATDIAARGLDIPAVDHVVHYQIPRSTDVYVHRNGRTARAMRDGFSLLMCAPDERRLVRALMGSLGRREDEIPEMNVDLYLLDKLKTRIQVARQIDSAQHKTKKENHEKNWLKEAAEAMEIEIDSDLGISSDEDIKGAPSKQKRKQTNTKTTSLKAELKSLLSQPLVVRGVSTRYITSGNISIADDVVAGEYHETMLGLKRTQAGQDVVTPKPKKPKKVKEEFEEWNGISGP